eukprot:632970-Alexandrium_andersonii.AAC.1
MGTRVTRCVFLRGGQLGEARTTSGNRLALCIFVAPLIKTQLEHRGANQPNPPGRVLTAHSIA